MYQELDKSCVNTKLYQKAPGHFLRDTVVREGSCRMFEQKMLESSNPVYNAVTGSRDLSESMKSGNSSTS